MTPRPGLLRRGLTRWGIPGLILGAGLAAAALAFQTVEDAEQDRAHAAFEVTVSRITEVVKDDAIQAQDLLASAQSFWTAHPDAGPEAFSTFLRGVWGLVRTDAVRAIGLFPRVPEENLDDLWARIDRQRAVRRALGYPAQTIWPESGAAERYPGVAVEPPTARAGVLGYDIFSNEERRAAGLRAVRERRMVSSAPVALTQDSGETRASVLILAPLFVAPHVEGWWIVDPVAAADPSVDERHVGFVAMGFSPSHGLRSRVTAIQGGELSVAVWDGGPQFVGMDRADTASPQEVPPAGDPRLFFAAGPAFANGAAGAVPDMVRGIPFAGRMWWVGVSGRDAMRPLASRLTPPALGLAMLIGALALAALSHRLSRQRALLQAGVEARTQALTAANVALMESRARAEAASAAKTQFMAAMNHELRTPLNAIIGFAQMIHDGIGMGSDPERDKATVQAYCGHILTAGQSLLAQVNQVLDLSRIEAKGVLLSSEPLDLAAAARAMIEMIAPIAQDRDLTLRLEASADLPLVQADPQAVRQILDNLISNAMKFSPRKAQVVVSVARGAQAGEAVIRVSDNGPGIPPEHIAKVVEPFHQVADQWSRAHGGLGLGLAIVKDLAEGMGGRLSIESQPGQGTTVSVTLPLAVTAGRADQ